MGATHSHDEADILAWCIDNIKALQGQQSAATPVRGTATLTAGAATVALTTVTAASKIIVGTVTPGGTVGAPFVYSKTPGTGFTIHSTSGTDTSVVAYVIF